MKSYKDAQELSKDIQNPKKRKRIIIWVIVVCILLFSRVWIEQVALLVWNKIFLSSKDNLSFPENQPDNKIKQQVEVKDSPGAIVTVGDGNKINSNSSLELFKRQAFKLLAKDAINIYIIGKIWAKQFNEPNHIVLPQEVSLENWDVIKRNGDFLYLQTEKDFEGIIGKFKDFEKLNEEVKRSKTGDRGAYDMSWGLSMVFFVTDKDHIKLLKMFKDNEEVEKLIKTEKID